MSTRTEAVTPATSAMGAQRVRTRREVIVAAVLFALVLIQLVPAIAAARTASDPRASIELAFLIVLAIGYFGPSVEAARLAVRSVFPTSGTAALAGCGALFTAAIVYAYSEGLSMLARLLPYAAYLFIPAATLMLPAASASRSRVHLLLVATALWLPIEFHLLPSLPLPAPSGLDTIRFVGIVAAFYLLTVARPIDRIGYSFLLSRRDVKLACGGLIVYAAVALPLGLISRFLVWHPDVNAVALLGPARAAALATLLLRAASIYLSTAVPEEFLFRGVLQNLIAQMFGRGRALVVASILFGFAHLPDPRYVFLASLAGLAYGWVFARTGKITASAVTHAIVDWIWVTLLRA